jgi:hypothetical protein
MTNDIINYHSNMVRALAKSGDTIAAELTGEDAHMLHMAVGVCGEASELLDAVSANDDGAPLDYKNILEELGDLEFYMEGVRQACSISREDCLHMISMHEPLALMRSSVGICIWSGHLIDAVKKRAIYRKALDLAAVKNALEHLEYGIAGVRHSLDFTREECLEANIQKLGKRYEGMRYSDVAAQVRADKVVDVVPASMSGLVNSAPPKYVKDEGNEAQPPSIVRELAAHMSHGDIR